MAAAEPFPETLKAAAPKIDQLIALFNAKAMDLPDGLFGRTSQFLLNGTPYETLLGRSPSDPLVLMLARGPAGYRFIAKALQHAVPDAAVQRGEIAWPRDQARCEAELWLSGHLRGSSEAMNVVVGVVLTFAPNGCVDQAAVWIEQTALGRLRDARLRP